MLRMEIEYVCVQRGRGGARLSRVPFENRVSERGEESGERARAAAAARVWVRVVEIAFSPRKATQRPSERNGSASNSTTSERPLPCWWIASSSFFVFISRENESGHHQSRTETESAQGLIRGQAFSSARAETRCKHTPPRVTVFRVRHLKDLGISAHLNGHCGLVFCDCISSKVGSLPPWRLCRSGVRWSRKQRRWLLLCSEGGEAK